MKIAKVIPRMILDSRGVPTVECDIHIEGYEFFGRASVPSGASTGRKEAIELRDGDINNYNGKGVKHAISNINNIIAPNIVGKIFHQFKELDELLCNLDGTNNKEFLGANAILATSLAFAQAQSAMLKMPMHKLLSDVCKIKNPKLPKPMFNVINGGAHADNNVDIQEFMIMPQFEDYNQNLQAGCEIVYSLKSILKQHGYSTNTGDEGGFAPELNSNTQALDLIEKAVDAAGYKFGGDIQICLDIAASEFYSSNKNGIGKYFLKNEKLELNSSQLIEFYIDLCNRYPIYSIEDPMAEDDIEGWKACSKAMCKGANSIQIVGDDLFVTNLPIFKNLSQQGIANAILIKPNQIGTLTETLDVIMHAKKNGYNTIISHRSGETEDVSIAHIAFGMDASQIKAGAPVRTDRTSKFNELLRIVDNK